jgi:hypothetical protein
MAVNVARPGYELWRPNRVKAEAKTMKAIVALVFLASAVLLAIITLGGWERLASPGVGAMTLGWAALYVVFAFLVMRWNRGILPVAAALAIIMAIFAAIAAPDWFARSKTGLDSPALPEDLLGLLTLLMIPVQLLLVAVSMVGFNQNWHVEEERRVAGGAAAPAAYDEDETTANRPELGDEDETVVNEDRPPGGEDIDPPPERS